MKHYPHQPLVIEKYNLEWPQMYLEEKEKIEQKLGAHLIEIEHIGSTAIPGLSAKPIIDIVISIKSEEEAEECLRLLEELDYEYMDKPEQWYLRKNTGLSNGFHVHMVVGKSPYWTRALAIKQYLLSDPEMQRQYQELKEKLVKQFGEDRNKYREAKSEFMKQLIQAALHS